MRGAADLDSPRAVLLGLFVVVLLVLGFAVTSSTASLSPFNSGWNGASALQSEANAVGSETEIVLDADRYRSAPPGRSVAVVLSPETAYGPGERRAVASFVREGGMLVVADDFGPHGNSLLAAVGADARFDGRPLRDERHNFRSPALPVASNGSSTSVTAPSTTLTLNHGTAVVANGATVALTTSEFAYLDANRNEEYDNETLAAYPVVTVERVGQGVVVAVGDPSVFLNSMLDRPGNRAFVRSLLRGQFVLLDRSHSGAAPPPVAYWLTVARDSPVLQAAFCTAGIAAIVLLSRTPAPGALRSRSPRRADTPAAVDRDALVRYLRRRHPDWDEHRIDRLVAEIMTDQREDTNDD